MEQTKFYTKKQTAQILQVHPRTIERYLLSGKLEGAKIGKSWKISSSDIENFYNAVKEETAQYRRTHTNENENTTG